MNRSSQTDNMQNTTFFSILYMGLGHIVCLKQYLKGTLLVMFETAFLFLLPWITEKISGLITLGNVPGNEDNVLGIHSMFYLIDGVIAAAIILVFVIAYILSIRGARNACAAALRSQHMTVKSKRSGHLGSRAFVGIGLSPALLLLVFFVIVPLGFSILVSFTNYSAPDHIPPRNLSQWVGLDNYRLMFGGDAIWSSALLRVVGWTILWAFLATFTSYAGGMVLAVLLSDHRIRLARLFRSIYILPYAIPGVVSMIVWRDMLNGSFGIINQTLLAMGVISNVNQLPWLSDVHLAKFSLVLVNFWISFPYSMLLVTGSLTAISENILEAGRIDGANRFQLFRYISLPSILYQTAPLIVMSVSSNINNFGAIYFITEGDPVVADSTLTVAYGTDIIISWIYKLTINRQLYQYASVLAVMLFLFLAPFAIMNFMRTKAFKEGDL